MEFSGINWWLVAAQVANLLLVLLWVSLGVAAVRRLRDRALPPTAEAIWIALIVLVPVIGAALCLWFYPRRARQPAER